MAAPTRFSRVGLSGRKGDDNKTDGFIQVIVAPIVAVASTAVQDTGVALPANFQPISAVLNIITAEVTGTIKTVDVGLTANPDQFIVGAVTSALGFAGTLAAVANVNTGENIFYQLPDTTGVELEAEVLIFGIGTV